MSLRGMLRNYFTVATSSMAPIDSEGAVDRDYHLVVLSDYVNKRCAIQGVSKKDVVEIYGKKEDASIFVLFHQLAELEVSSATFIVTHKNPKLMITDFNDRANLVVYQYLGQRDPVKHMSRNVPLSIYMEKNDRWNL